MVWWWVGNVVLLVVVAPAVTLLLHRLTHPVQEIQAYAEDVREHAGGILGELEALETVVQTRELVAQGGAGVQGYAAAIDELISR